MAVIIGNWVCYWVAPLDEALIQVVARQVSEDATAESVEKRWINTVNPARPTGPWTPEEDQRLQHAVGIFDQQWAQIAPFMGGRTAGQCRDHFEDGLKPTLKKDSWTSEELEQLRVLVGELGNKWTEIAKRLEGRSDAQVFLSEHHGVPCTEIALPVSQGLGETSAGRGSRATQEEGSAFYARGRPFVGRRRHPTSCEGACQTER